MSLAVDLLGGVQRKVMSPLLHPTLLKAFGSSEMMALEAEPKFRKEVSRGMGSREGDTKASCHHWKAGISELCLEHKCIVGTQLVLVEHKNGFITACVLLFGFFFFFF